MKDPFYEHMPAHFGLTFKELLAAKHPTKWMEFEKGQASEAELFEMFFQDGRAVDGDALKSMLVRSINKPWFPLRCKSGRCALFCPRTPLALTTLLPLGAWPMLLMKWR